MSNIDTRSPFFPNGKKPIAESNGSKGVGISQQGINSNAPGVNPLSGDSRVSIPDGVRDFSRIKKAVDASPDVDNSEKIARLKAQIQAGTYEVDYDGLADKMLASDY
jgi:negative regulator of flagellin synthesis FlgM